MYFINVSVYRTAQREAEQTIFARRYLCSFCFNKIFIISPEREIRRNGPKDVRIIYGKAKQLYAIYAAVAGTEKL